MNDDQYKGIRVGVEVEVGNHLPIDDGLVNAVIILTELKNHNPKAFKAAVTAIQEMDK